MRILILLLLLVSSNQIFSQTVDSSQVYFLWGMDAYKQRDLPTALDNFNHALTFNDGVDLIYFRRALVYEKLNRLDDANTDYQTAISISPKAIYYNNLGINKAIVKAYNEAIEAYNSAIELDSFYAQAWLNRSVAYHYKENYAQACSDARKAKELGLEMVQTYLTDYCEDSGNQ